MKNLNEYVNNELNNTFVYEGWEHKDLDKALSNFIGEIGLNEKAFRELLSKEGIDSKYRGINNPIQLGEAVMCLGFNILVSEDYQNLIGIIDLNILLLTLKRPIAI